MEAFAKAEKRKRPNPEFLFTDVYDDMPPHLQKQMDDMKKHVAKYPQGYPLDAHESMS